MARRWEEIESEFWDHEYQCVTFHVHYKNGTIMGTKRLRRHEEKRIPYSLLEERKVGRSWTVKGKNKVWKEGTQKRPKRRW